MALIKVGNTTSKSTSISVDLGATGINIKVDKLTCTSTVGSETVNVSKNITVKPKIYYVKYIDELSTADIPLVGFYYGLKSVNDTSSVITLMQPEHLGYIFKGWYKDSNFNTKCSSFEANTREDIVLYAKWDPLFNIVNPTEELSERGSISLSVNTEVEGISWSSADTSIAEVSSTGVVTGKKAGTVKISATYGVLTQTITLNVLPVWTVAIDVNNGSVGSSALSYSVVDGHTVSLPTPTRAGYNFVGWHIGDEYVTNETVIHSNINLTAEWADVDAPSLVRNIHAVVGHTVGSARKVSVMWVNPDSDGGTALSKIKVEGYYNGSLIYSTDVNASSEPKADFTISSASVLPYIVKIYSVDEAGNVSEPASITVYPDFIRTKFDGVDKDYLSLGTLDLSLECVGHSCVPTWSLDKDTYLTLFGTQITGISYSGDVTTTISASVGNVVYTKDIKVSRPFTATLTSSILKGSLITGSINVEKEYDVQDCNITWASANEDIVQVTSSGEYTASSLSSARTGSTNLVGTMDIDDVTFTVELPVAVQFMPCVEYITGAKVLSSVNTVYTNGVAKPYTFTGQAEITSIVGKSSTATITTNSSSTETTVRSISSSTYKYENRKYTVISTNGTNNYVSEMNIEVFATGAIKVTYGSTACSDYVICFDIVGGSLEGSSTITSFTQGETTYKPADPFWGGYIFGGWYTDNTYTTKYDFSKAPSEEITIIYAKWINGFDIIYNSSVYNGTRIEVGEEGVDISVVKRPELNEPTYIAKLNQIQQNMGVILFDWDSIGQNNIAYFDDSRTNTTAKLRVNNNSGTTDTIGITICNCTQYINVTKA